MKSHTNVTMVLAFLAASVFSSPRHAPASEYSNGYVSAAGYTFRDGYWYQGDTAYQRITTKVPYTYNTYGHCGTCYPVTAYRYSYSYKPVEVKKTTVTYSEDQWRARLLELVKARDTYESQIRYSQTEQAEFLEAVRALGLEGNFHYDGYGRPVVSYEKQKYQHEYQQFPQQQGATIYGYRELADIYGNVDLGQIYNSVLRLREQSYANESEATTQVHTLVGTLAERMAQIKEIEARGRTAAQVLTATEPKDRATVLREFWSSQPGGRVRIERTTVGSADGVIDAVGAGAAQAAGAVADAAREQALQKVQSIVQSKCLACHNDAKESGGLNLTQLELLTQAQAGKILERIKPTTDPALRMPLAADHSPGEPLSPEEVAAFFVAAYGSASAPQGSRDNGKTYY